MSDLSLIIGNKNYSSWSLRPWLLLRQAGIPFREHRLPIGSAQWHAEIGRYSPSGRVPALEHGALRVWDSLAICEYLAERFPDKQLWPADAGARALQRGGFDVVVCNPPFRKPDTGLLSRGDERAIARHELRLPLPSLFGAAAALLRHHGRFFMIHLPERLAEITSAAKDHNLQPKRMRFVHSHQKSEAKMVLIELVRGGRSGLKVEPPLFIYDEGVTYSDEMREICGGGVEG